METKKRHNTVKDYGKYNTIEVRNIEGAIEYLKFCLACGDYYTSQRDDKLTCSTNCKQKLTYRLNKNFEPIIDREMRAKPTEEILTKFGFKTYSK